MIESIRFSLAYRSWLLIWTHLKWWVIMMITITESETCLILKLQKLFFFFHMN